MRKASALALAATFIFSGCSSKIEIEGEAFTENNGIATKLANVEIQIVSEENFVKYIKSKSESIDAELAKIKSRIDSKEKFIAEISKTSQALEDSQSRMSNLSAMGGWNINTLGGQYRQNQQDAISADGSAAVAKAKELVNKSRQEIEQLNKLITGLKSGKNGNYYYSEKIPGAILKIATGSDGKFSIDTPSDKRVALVASKGDNFWFLWVSPKGPKNLSLSNMNLIETNCDICIFNDSATPQSL